jgi:hypothetical protein
MPAGKSNDVELDSVRSAQQTLERSIAEVARHPVEHHPRRQATP